MLIIADPISAILMVFFYRAAAVKEISVLGMNISLALTGTAAAIQTARTYNIIRKNQYAIRKATSSSVMNAFITD